MNGAKTEDRGQRSVVGSQWSVVKQCDRIECGFFEQKITKITKILCYLCFLL